MTNETGSRIFLVAYEGADDKPYAMAFSTHSAARRAAKTHEGEVIDTHIDVHVDNTKATTRDVGLAIRDFLEGQDFQIYAEDKDGTLLHGGDAAAEIVDASDPNNLNVVLDNGQTFTVRIIAGTR